MDNIPVTTNSAFLHHLPDEGPPPANEPLPWEEVKTSPDVQEILSTARKELRDKDGQNVAAPLNPTGSGWDPKVAQEEFRLPELPESVKQAMGQPSDMDLLHKRINELEQMIRENDQNYRQGFAYLCNSMQWLVTMLSGVAELAQKMPGMGGMVARMMAPKGGN